MSKKKGRPSKAKNPKNAAWMVVHKKALSALSGAMTLIGFIVAVITFYPRPTVTQSDPVDPSNPFSASFTITNNTFIPLEHVTAFLGIGQIESEPAAAIPNFHPNFSTHLVKTNDWENHYLGRDERFAITPSDIFSKGSGKISFADVAIGITYKPWFLPWKMEKMFRFVTHKQPNGLYWYSFPLN